MKQHEFREWLAGGCPPSVQGSLTKTGLPEIPPGDFPRECFIGVDPGSRNGDSTCFVRMERSPMDNSWIVLKCLTLPQGGHQVTHSQRIDDGDTAACGASQDAKALLLERIASGLDLPREMVAEMLRGKGERIYRLPMMSGAITCSF